MEAKKDSYKFIGAFELFEPSMRAIRFNLSTFLLLVVSVIAAMFLPLSIAFTVAGVSHRTNATADSTALIIISSLFGIVLIAFLIILFSSLIALGLNSVRGKKMSYKEALLTGRQFALRLVGLGLCAGVLILLGLLLFIVPGIFMLKRYILASYYLVDKNLGVFEAMRQSAADSKKFSGPIWGLVGVTILFGIIANLPLIGFLASIGQLLYGFAPAKRYDEIQHALGHTHAPKVTAHQSPVAT